MPDLPPKPWTMWEQHPITADASPRRYTRLVGPNGECVIDMQSHDTPTAPFLDMANHLSVLGLCPPDLLWQGTDRLILSDLGRTDLATALRNGAEPEQLYAAVLDILIVLHSSPPPPHLTRLTPDVAGDMVRITAETYAPDADGDALAAGITDHMRQICPTPKKLALRDFHAENLIWRPEKYDTNRVGLLDFQDAVIAPAGYDLASLLRDIRHPVPEELVTRFTTLFSDRLGMDREEFAAQRALLGAQRNLRILGVFARLQSAPNGFKYRALLPRTWDLLQADLAHSALTSLRTTINKTLPDPQKAGYA